MQAASIIGTREWVAAQRDERAAQTAQRVAALRSAGLAQADGSFAGCAAPSGRGEPVGGAAYAGYAGDTAQLSLSVRRTARAGRLVRRAADRRAAVVSAARARRTAAVAAQRAAQPVERLHGAARLLKGYARPLDKYAALDEWITQRDADRRTIEQTMAHAPSGDGRGTSAGWEDAGTVNGTQVRVQPVWSGSKRSAITTTNERGETVPVDWGCYRVEADGSRTPLTVKGQPRKPRGGKRKGQPSKAAQLNALLAAATTAGHVDAATAA